MIDNPDLAEYNEKHKQGRSSRSAYTLSRLFRERLLLNHVSAQNPPKSLSVKKFADLLTFADQVDKSKQGKGHWKPELASNSEEAVCLPPSLTTAWEPRP